MKPEELQLGDIVATAPSGMPIKVVAIHKKKVAYHACTDRFSWVRIGLLQPIPLTPEILEQNGFVKQAYDGWLISENNGRRLIEYRTDYFDGLLRINYAEEPFSKLTIKVKYFHELQHALRLCGINKEIEI